MCFIGEISTVVVTVAFPLDSNAHVGIVAYLAIFVLVTRSPATCLVFGFRAVRHTITPFFHWYACT